MPYCPKCESEYAEGILECIECRVPLRPGHRPIRRSRFDLDFDELLVPVGSAICLFLAAALVVLYLSARSGNLPQPMGDLILATQPTCLVAFYMIGGVVSAAVLAFWLLQRILGGRRG